ncbi:MAG: Crp/Fnr family transcriptional regulator [Bdellovibrio bacteriovorus]
MSASGLDWRPLFPSIAAADAESQRLMDMAQVVNLEAGQMVFHAGSPCRSYVLLLEGSVRVQLIGEGGREALLYRVQPGQSCILTTCCVLSDEDYPAEGCTEAPVSALAISKPAFDRALESAPAFRRFVFDNLGGRVAEVIARMEELTFRPVERRLAGYLLARTSRGEALVATHQEIAAELGTAREVVSRHLKRLETAGLVSLGRGTVAVTDRSGLDRLRELCA